MRRMMLRLDDHPHPRELPGDSVEESAHVGLQVGRGNAFSRDADGHDPRAAMPDRQMRQLDEFDHVVEHDGPGGTELLYKDCALMRVELACQWSPDSSGSTRFAVSKASIVAWPSDR